MRWARKRSTHEEMRNAYRILVRTPQQKRQLGRLGAAQYENGSWRKSVKLWTGFKLFTTGSNEDLT